MILSARDEGSTVSNRLLKENSVGQRERTESNGVTAKYLNFSVLVLFSSCLYELALYMFGFPLCRCVYNLLTNHRNDPLAMAKDGELGLSVFIQETIPMLLSDTGDSLSTFLTQLIHLNQQTGSRAF